MTNKRKTLRVQPPKTLPEVLAADAAVFETCNISQLHKILGVLGVPRQRELSKAALLTAINQVTFQLSGATFGLESKPEVNCTTLDGELHV